MGVSAGWDIFAGRWVYAYNDALTHFPFWPGNPPVLYRGLLVGFGAGVPEIKFGAMGTASKAALLFSIPFH